MADEISTTAAPIQEGASTGMSPIAPVSPTKDGILKVLLSNLVYDMQTKKLSWSKLWAMITAFFGSVVTLHDQMASIGIAIPAELMPYFKIALLFSAMTTAIRVRNTIPTGKQEVV